MTLVIRGTVGTNPGFTDINLGDNGPVARVVDVQYLSVMKR